MGEVKMKAKVKKKKQSKSKATPKEEGNALYKKKKFEEVFSISLHFVIY